MDSSTGRSVPALVQRHRTLLRDAAAATALLAALYLVGTASESRVLVLPLYFLLVAVGLVEALLAWAGVAVVPGGVLHAALVAGTVLALGAIGAGVVHLVLARVDGDGRSTLGPVLAAPIGVIGVLALLVAVTVALTTSQLEPVAYSGLIATVCLALAGLLSGAVDFRPAIGR